jgi:hypothetical protein
MSASELCVTAPFVRVQKFSRAVKTIAVENRCRINIPVPFVTPQNDARAISNGQGRSILLRRYFADSEMPRMPELMGIYAYVLILWSKESACSQTRHALHQRL